MNDDSFHTGKEVACLPGNRLSWEQGVGAEERSNMRVKGWAWDNLSCRLGSMAFPPECPMCLGWVRLLLRTVNRTYSVTIVEWEYKLFSAEMRFLGSIIRSWVGGWGIRT